MRAVIHYTDELSESRSMANRALASFVGGWEPELHQGYTPQTVPDAPIMKGGLLDTYEGVKRQTKLACFMNHVRLWKEVIANNVAMAFVEHDARCIGDPVALTEDVTHLAHETAKMSRRVDGIKVSKHYGLRNHLQGASVMPGTSAYAVTPSGARKLLDAFFRHGADQSDWFINSKVVGIGFASPIELIHNTFNSSSGRYWQ